jgi:signal transduction histidine kinase/Flp pilus assembly protein TadD
MKSLICFLVFLLCAQLHNCEANPQIDSLKNVVANSTDDSVKIAILYKLIKIQKRTDPSKAIEFADQALSLAKRNEDQKNIATSLRKKAQLLIVIGKTDEAIASFKHSIQLYKSIGLKKGMAYSYNNLGMLYQQIGNYEEALYNFQESLKLGGEIEDSLVICTGYNNFGNIYYNQYDYANALSNYHKAYEIADMIGLGVRLGDYASNIGNAYFMEGNYQHALEYYEKAISINAKNKNLRGTARVLSSMGKVFETMGNYVMALEYFRKSMDLKKQMNDKLGLSETLVSISEMYKNNGEIDKSITYSIKSLEIAEPMGFAEQMKCSYENLYVAYDQKRDHEKALEYYTMFRDLENEIYLQRQNEAVADLQTKYETEKKEKEIVLLTKVNQEQNLLLLKQKNFRNVLFLVLLLIFIVATGMFFRYRAKKKMNETLRGKNREIEKRKNEVELLNTNLRELNSAKDKFFAIVSHDLKNPINLLTLSTSYMLKNLYETDKDKLGLYLENMNKSAQSLEFLLKNLLNWAQSQLGTLQFNPQKTDVTVLVSKCMQELEPFATQKGISIKTIIPDETYILVDAEMIATVIRNIISNAIKFTDTGGRIDVTSRKVKDAVEISICDDGIGMDEETRKGIFKIDQKKSAQGTAGERGTGLGLILCNELIQKNNPAGKGLKIESTPGKGSCFYFRLPSFPPANP